MTSIAFINELDREFNQQSNLIIAKKQKAYMRHQFDFYGLTADLRRKIQTPLLEKHNLLSINKYDQLIKSLWKKKERDYQYCAQELLLQNLHYFKRVDICLFEFMIINKSWWDTIDVIAPKILGEYFKLYPKEIEKNINKWLDSNNIWLQRSCLLFQLKYKTNLNTQLLTYIIHSLLDSKEFFINKAIGWILREYSKTDSDWVIDLVQKINLSKLSSKEALKFISSRK